MVFFILNIIKMINKKTSKLIRQISNEWIIDKKITEKNIKRTIKKTIKELKEYEPINEVERIVKSRTLTILYLMKRHKKYKWVWISDKAKSLLAYLWYFWDYFYGEEVLTTNENNNDK